MRKIHSLEADDGLGQHEKDPESKDGRCFCPRIYGERDYKTFGYLHDIKKPRSKCTEKEIGMIYQKATAMNAAVVFADDSPDVRKQREEVAQQLWEDSKRTAAWGCRWYVVWLERVEEAVRRKQRLKVVFFPNEVEQGFVPMKDLPTSNLWDGKGCGGSQKCEIATLKAGCAGMCGGAGFQSCGQTFETAGAMAFLRSLVLVSASEQALKHVLVHKRETVCVRVGWKRK